MIPVTEGFTAGHLRRTGAPPVCHGHRHRICGASRDQRVAPEDTHKGEEHVGVDRAAGDLATDEKSSVKPASHSGRCGVL